MTLNKRQSYVYLLILAVIAFILFSLFNNRHTVETQYALIEHPWEKHISIYNWDYLKHRLYSIGGFYEEYAWTVHLSYSVIVISCLAMIVLLYVLFWDVYTRKKKDKSYRMLKDAYYEKLKKIIFSDQNFTKEEIQDSLDINTDAPFSYARKLQLIDLLLELRMEDTFTQQALHNMQQTVHALGLYEFMESRLIAGKDKDKLKMIQAIRLLHMDISDSLMTGLINHRTTDLRKAARLYYVLSNEEDPFRYFENNTTSDKDFLPWDVLEMHQLFEDCNRMNKKLPSFIPVLNQIKNRLLTAFFIRETAYWGSSKDMDHLITYLDAEEETYREAAIESVSQRPVKDAETEIEERYYKQPEHIRRTILYALYRISPVNSIPFFKEAYENTASLLTKRTALYCLWNGGESGQAMFRQLKAQASPQEMILFCHVENRLNNRERINIYNAN